MSRRDVLALRVTAAWTLFVWVVFIRNQIGNDDTSTGFKVVHLTLAAVSIALGVVVWRVASRHTPRARREREREHDRSAT